MKLLNSLPRQPFLGLALAAASGILLADFHPSHSRATLISVAILAVAALLSRRSCVVYALVASGFFTVHSFRVGDSPVTRFAQELGEEPRPVVVQGSVMSEPKIALSGIASFLLQAESIELDGVTRPCHLKFLTRWQGPVDLGDEVSLFGTAERPDSPRNPGEFDLWSYLLRQDIRRLLIVRYPENGMILRHTNGYLIRRVARRTRELLQTVLSRDLETAPDVTGAITGMILGLRHQGLDDIEEPFQQTGTLHLFAVAGLHVGIIARLLWIIATVARLPRTVATALIIPALLFYSAVTGLHVSSVRAAVMSAAFLAGFFAERKVLPLNNLAAAAMLMLCWNTNEVFSVGFQLSFCVVSAIILLADPVNRSFRRLFAPDPFLPRNLFNRRQRIIGRFTSNLAQAASVSLSAWVGSLPLMIAYYSLVTPISLLANLVVVPIAFFVLAVGLVAVVCAPLSTWLSVVFNNTNWLLTKIILECVQLFGQIPGGHLYVDHWRSPNSVKLEINVLDLRSGGAIHVRTPKSDWLFDAGPAREYDRVVRQYLRFRGVDTLEGLVLTHGDGGHMGGAIGILRDFCPRQLIDTAAEDRSLIHRQLIADLSRNRHSRRFCARGDEIVLSPEVKARVLFPPHKFRGARADDQALVVMLELLGQSRVLLMSDSGEATEKFLIENYSDLRCDLLVKGQHHSGVSGSATFLDSVNPRAIVATSRDFPWTEQLDDQWVESLSRREIKLFRQDQAGMVQIQFSKGAWKVNTYVSGETFRSKSK